MSKYIGKIKCDKEIIEIFHNHDENNCSYKDQEAYNRNKSKAIEAIFTHPQKNFAQPKATLPILPSCFTAKHPSKSNTTIWQ